MKPITFPPHYYQAYYNPRTSRFFSELHFLGHYIMVDVRGLNLLLGSFNRFENDLSTFMSSALLADPHRHHPAIPELLSAIRNNS